MIFFTCSIPNCRLDKIFSFSHYLSKVLIYQIMSNKEIMNSFNYIFFSISTFLLNHCHSLCELLNFSILYGTLEIPANVDSNSLGQSKLQDIYPELLLLQRWLLNHTTIFLILLSLILIFDILPE
jgi:hypothetical protein